MRRSAVTIGPSAGQPPSFDRSAQRVEPSGAEPLGPRTGLAPELPYPLLRRNTPVLRRAPGTLQIGLDDGLVLEHATPALERLLAMLDGCHHRSEIDKAAERSAFSHVALAETLRRLQQAGLVGDGPHGVAESRRPTPVRLLEAGRLGRAVAELLVGSGVSDLEIVDNAPADPALYPDHVAGQSQAEALCATLKLIRGPGAAFEQATRTVAAGTWLPVPPPTGSRSRSSASTSPEPALTVVAGDTLEVDRLLSDSLLQADQPHLLVHASGAGMDVGPLVLPGVTPCVRCTDLARREVDPGWPILLPQVCRVRASTTPALLGWAAGVTATQVLGYLAGERPDSAGATIELSAYDFATRLRVWSVHPDCGCAWRAGAQ